MGIVTDQTQEFSQNECGNCDRTSVENLGLSEIDLGNSEIEINNIQESAHRNSEIWAENFQIKSKNFRKSNIRTI